MKAGVGLAFVALMLPLAAVVYAAEYNFYEQADRKGCASIITERGQLDCAKVQQAKDEACSAPVECEPDKHEKLIASYKEAKERLDSGKVNDSDKDRLKETVQRLKEQLDRAKAAAREGTSIANRCVTARENVQKWFMGIGIRLTEQTRDDALKLRKELLDKLAETQKKQTEAKSKREAKPNDSSAQSDYDRATEEMRNAEKALEQFNNKYGKEIAHYAEKLIKQYIAENESHQTPLNQAKDRVEKCKKVDNMSY